MQQLVSRHEHAYVASGARDSAIGTLLVTGGTGFIGGAVLAELLVSPLWAKTLILARGNECATARERIVQSLQRFYPGLPVAQLVGEHQIVTGGLDDPAFLATEARVRRVTHVIHAAAVTSFSASPKIRAINVDASLEFVRVLGQRAALKRFLNVGTAWCVGMRGAGVVVEDANPLTSRHVVPYTASKIEFEQEVRARYPELAFVTARPSIVVGHTRLGTAPSASIYWVFRSGQLLGRFTASYDDFVDVVPVDWVAAALLKLVSKKTLAHDAYHLSAGRSGASTLGQLDFAIAKGRKSEPNGRAGYRQVDNAALSSAVYNQRQRLGDVKPKLLARALCLYGEFARSGTVFDNTRALEEGISPPPPFFSYAHTCAETAERSSISTQMADDFKC